MAEVRRGSPRARRAGGKAGDQLHRALANRDLIGEAKGVIMERYDIDAVKAFALLTRLSQDQNTKLLDLAKRVVEAQQHQR